jgi:hypothetical protein
MAAIFIRPTPVVDTQTRQQPERSCVIAPVGVRTVASDLTEWTAAGEEAVASLDHAEFVVTRIAQHNVPLLGQLAEVEVASADAQGLLDRGPLPLRTGAGEVQMQSVEPDLLGRSRHEAQPDLPLVPREQHAVVRRFSTVPP